MPRDANFRRTLGAAASPQMHEIAVKMLVSIIAAPKVPLVMMYLLPLSLIEVDQHSCNHKSIWNCIHPCHHHNHYLGSSSSWTFFSTHRHHAYPAVISFGDVLSSMPTSSHSLES